MGSAAKLIKPRCNIPSFLIVLPMAMDEKAFKKIVLDNKDQVFNYALHLVRSQEDAEDIAQEVFIRLWKYRWSNHIKSPRAWLFRVTHNLCIDRIRLQRRQNKTFKPIDNPVNKKAASNQQHVQMIEAERAELQEQLSTALMNLPAKLRSVIILREIQGFCYREIADILGMQMNNVKVSIHRAKKALKKFLIASYKNFKEELS